MDLSKEPENEFKVGWCPICNQGWQVIVKDTDTEKLFIMCEECLSLWDHPLNIKMGKKALDKNNWIDEVIPTYREIERAGWVRYLVEEV